MKYLDIFLGSLWGISAGLAFTYTPPKFAIVCGFILASAYFFRRMEETFKALNGAAEHHKKLDGEYAWLRCQPRVEVKPGDKVVIASGLLGHGHPWIRQECEVLDVEGDAVQVYWREEPDYEWTKWIDPVLIVSNLTTRQSSQLTQKG